MEYFSDKELLRSLPTKRAAYSDRTALIMAELSRLVYKNLPGEDDLERKVDHIYKLIQCKKDLKEIKLLIKQTLKDEDKDSEVESVLKNSEVKIIQFEKSFNELGTQAMLVRLERSENFEGMLILVFRGTEPTSIEDIKTDLNAGLTDADGGGQIHKGFKDAFDLVKKQIEDELKKYEGEKLPLYITGHSLGGALALVATRYLASDSTGATYTFGAPRVGDDLFFKNIKTPVYRVVNLADAVPRLPLGALLFYILAVLEFIPINGTKVISNWIREYFGGYTHHGTMVFLAQQEDEVIVKFSPSIFKRAQYVLPRLFQSSFKATFLDHSIEEYCMKLLKYAQQRN